VKARQRGSDQPDTDRGAALPAERPRDALAAAGLVRGLLRRLELVDGRHSASLPEQIEKMTADDDVICAFGGPRKFATQVREFAYDAKCMP
jgi:hypothetical protein